MAEQSLKEKTAKGLFWGGLNNGAQQIINLVFGIFLARILSPGDYGLVGMLAVFTSMAALMQDSGFTAALINKKEFRHEDYNAVFWFSTGVGCSLYIILFFASPLIADFFHQPVLKDLSRVMFLWFLFGCTGTVHSAILQKRLMVKERAQIDIISLSIACTAGLIMALNGFAYWGLALQTVLHSFIGTLLKWYYSPWRPTFNIDFKPLREMFPFSAKILFTGIFTLINNNIFSILLGRFYTKQEVGYYSQGNKWMYMGYSLIWNMINSVSQPVLAEVATDIERQKSIFRKMIRFVSFTSFPLMFGLALIAPELIPIAVSDKWLPSVPVLQILCIWGAFTPLSNLYSSMFISRGKSNIYLICTMTLGIVQLITIFFTTPYGLHTMLIAFVTINIGWLFVWQYFAWRYIEIRLKDVLFKDILPFLLTTVSVLVVTYFITSYVDNCYLRLGLKIVIAASIYLFVMHYSKSVIFKEAINFFLNRFHKL